MMTRLSIKKKTWKKIIPESLDNKPCDFNLNLVTWSWDAAYLQDKLYYKYFQSKKTATLNEQNAVSGLG